MGKLCSTKEQKNKYTKDLFKNGTYVESRTYLARILARLKLIGTPTISTISIVYQPPLLDIFIIKRKQ